MSHIPILFLPNCVSSFLISSCLLSISSTLSFFPLPLKIQEIRRRQRKRKRKERRFFFRSVKWNVSKNHILKRFDTFDTFSSSSLSLSFHSFSFLSFFVFHSFLTLSFPKPKNRRLSGELNNVCSIEKFNVCPL